MRKRWKIWTALSLASSLALPSWVLQAEDYSNESYWINKCTQIQSSQEGVTACEGFLDYQRAKKEALKDQINSFNTSMESLQEDVSAAEALAKEQRELQEQLDAEIEQTSAAIGELQENIDLATEKIDAYQGEIDEKTVLIEQKQKDIDIWDSQIKERMKEEQSRSGTNVYIDLVMGSTSLADMLRRVSGLERITQSDQDQIYDLNLLKASLEEDIADLENKKEEQEFVREDQKRLKEEQERNKAELEERQKAAEELEKAYQTLVEEYQKQLADLEAQMRSARQDMNAIREFVISTGLSNALDYEAIPTAAGWISPVSGYRRSAGTWAYNGGGIHLGLDMAAPIGTNVVAPISGLVIYTSNQQPTNSGYLGNWSGAPAGSGNCIEMLGEVNGTLYAIAFFHLSNIFNVSPGSQVSQGQVLALSGNSGNSTGAHTHVEIYNLGSRKMADAVAYFQRTGDWAFETSWGTTSTACEYKGSAPCRERPENFF